MKGYQEAKVEAEDYIKKDEKKKALDRQVSGDHYKTLAIQPIEYIMANELSWCEGNIIKYTTRHKQKGQRADIEKVIHYAEILLEEYDKHDKS